MSGKTNSIVYGSWKVVAIDRVGGISGWIVESGMDSDSISKSTITRYQITIYGNDNDNVVFYILSTIQLLHSVCDQHFSKLLY